MMSKPVELVTTLEGEDAKRFLRNLEHPPKNKALEETLARARKINKHIDWSESLTDWEME